MMQDTMTKNIMEMFQVQQIPFSFELEDFSDSIPLKLIQPLKLNVRFENNRYILENDELKMFSFDSDFEKAVLDMEQYFLSLWKNYVLIHENRLSPSGLRFKKLIQSYAVEA
ncbi:hypothetical protein [Methanolapillus ohkumae]|uniref:Uncharacterized protein n=1 Tax=Methanolapillus ohkumae TaxID=3028298 RepID=A0AA96V8W1_9EURY|nr:hypothetical protein MsAm2_12190 [Methanosarcinaceae archaeon Am2]